MNEKDDNEIDKEFEIVIVSHYRIRYKGFSFFLFVVTFLQEHLGLKGKLDSSKWSKDRKIMLINQYHNTHKNKLNGTKEVDLKVLNNENIDINHLFPIVMVNNIFI